MRNIVVVITLTCIIKSVVTGQAPAIAVELSNTPGKKAQTKTGTRIYHGWRNSCSPENYKKVKSGVSPRCARSIPVHVLYVSFIAPEKNPTTPLATQKRLPRIYYTQHLRVSLRMRTSDSSHLKKTIERKKTKREENKAKMEWKRKERKRKDKARQEKEAREGKERKGWERKGKERKGKERKGKERKGKERKGKTVLEAFFFSSFTHFYFPASGQAVVPSCPRFSIFIAHRVQQTHWCSPIFHRVLLTHALALSASQFVHKKNPYELIRGIL